jgi:hypothetical protein
MAAELELWKAHRVATVVQACRCVYRHFLHKCAHNASAGKRCWQPAPGACRRAPPVQPVCFWQCHPGVFGPLMRQASLALPVLSLTSTVSASWCVLNMGGGQGTLTTSNLRPLASVVDSKISTLREEHSYCRAQEAGATATSVTNDALW